MRFPAIGSVVRYTALDQDVIIQDPLWIEWANLSITMLKSWNWPAGLSIFSLDVFNSRGRSIDAPTDVTQTNVLAPIYTFKVPHTIRSPMFCPRKHREPDINSTLAGQFYPSIPDDTSELFLGGLPTTAIIF